MNLQTNEEKAVCKKCVRKHVEMTPIRSWSDEEETTNVIFFLVEDLAFIQLTTSPMATLKPLTLGPRGTEQG